MVSFSQTNHQNRICLLSYHWGGPVCPSYCGMRSQLEVSHRHTFEKLPGNDLDADLFGDVWAGIKWERSLFRDSRNPQNNKSFEENIHVGFFSFFFPELQRVLDVIFVVLDVEINVEFSWQIRKKINNLENIVSHFFRATGLLVYRGFCWWKWSATAVSQEASRNFPRRFCMSQLLSY